jgi:hypothetical protein
MQSHAHTPAPDDLRWASAAMLRITIGELREWEAVAARQRAALPIADEQAWEGTEIDVRRTVL